MTKLILTVFVLMSYGLAWGEINYSELARSKKFIGGIDEGELKVQAVLYQSPNKKKKQIQAEPSEGF